MTWNGSLGDIAVIECRYVVSYILVLLVGLVGGVLLSTCTNPSKRGSHEPTLSSVASVGSPKRVRNADFTSPVKVLHNIAGSFLRSSDAENVDIKPELQRIIKQAQSELFHILGVSIQPVDSPYVWQHVFSNSSSQFWMSSGRKNTIRLRGESSADSSAGCIVNYLLQHDLVTGIEGLGGKSEVISRSSTQNEVLIVRKFHCTMGSKVATSVFHLVTTISTQADGTYILATRSIPSDSFGDAISGSGSGSDKASGGRGIPHGKEAVRKELVGGVVYASGYLLRPVEFDGETGCEISFGCHLDLQGVTRAGRNNTANVNAILSAVLRTLKSIHNGEADCFRHLEGQSLSYLERVSAWGRTLRQPMFAQLKHSPEHSQKERGQRSPLQQLEIETDPAEEEYVQLHAPYTQSLSNAALPTTADRYRLLSVARDAANRMRTQYLETLQPDSAGPKPRSSFSGPLELRRETFYDHDGVVLRELSRSDLTVPSVLGMLSATFTVQVRVNISLFCLFCC